MISPEQIKMNIVKFGRRQTLLDFSYKSINEKKEKIYNDLVETIIGICENVPNGVLTIFPSYKIMNEFRFKLNNNNYFTRMAKLKNIIYEDRSN